MERTLWAVTDGDREHVALIAPHTGAVVFALALGLRAERLALDEQAQFLAAVAADGEVAVWDLGLRRPLARAASDAAQPVALQVDESEVTAICADGRLHALELPDLDPSWQAHLAAGVTAAETCGLTYAVCGDAVHALELGRVGADGVAPVRADRQLGLHPGGQRIARSVVRSVGVAGGGHLRLWSTDDGHATAEVALPEVIDLGFVYTGRGGERTIALTRRALHALSMEGAPLWTRPLDDEGAALLVGTHLGVISAITGRLTIFDLRGKPTATLEGWGGGVTATATDADQTLRRIAKAGAATAALPSSVGDAAPPAPAAPSAPPDPAPIASDPDSMDGRLRAPEPHDIDRWLAAGAFASLDAALAAVKMRPHALAAQAPRLAWADGAPLSAGAQGWYLAHLLAAQTYRQAGPADHRRPVRGAAALIEPALAPASRLALASWVLAQTLPASLKRAVPGGDDAVVDLVGAEVDAGRLDRRRAEALGGLGGPQWQRWRYRWARLRGMREVLAGLAPRDAAPLALDAAVEPHWPTGDDATGDAATWRGWIAEALERAMRWRRSWRLAALEAAYLGHPLAGSVAAGLVYLASGRPVCFVAGRAQDASGAPVPLAPDAEVVVAHPTDGTAGWPTPAETPPFDQRGWRVFGPEELPALPDAPIPHATWRARCDRLGLLGATGTGGGTEADELLVEPHAVVFGHAGYGAGYGGARPVTVREVSVRRHGLVLARLDATGATGWDALPAWLRSESVALARAVLGSKVSAPSGRRRR